MKNRFIALGGILSITILVSGCSLSNNAKVEEKNIEKGFKAEHLHGIAYAEDNNIYVATHEGMLTTGNSGEVWSLKGNYDFDFMGFNVMSDGTMITSGHPGKLSDLPNPLGLMVSGNNGEEWKSKSMLGKIDFHILSSNYNNPNVIYGVNQMDSEGYKAGVYVSTDKGKEWKRIDSKGLPENLHQIYSIISLPDNENILIAGTEAGVLRSLDGGETWDIEDSKRLITAISVLPDTKDLISYSITNNEVGIMISKDQGDTWVNLGNDLGEDAVAYFGINPKDSKKIAISTYENTVMLTEDGGNNWITLMDKGKIQ